jgi:hypothetical protein
MLRAKALAIKEAQWLEERELTTSLGYEPNVVKASREAKAKDEEGDDSCPPSHLSLWHIPLIISLVHVPRGGVPGPH